MDINIKASGIEHTEAIDAYTQKKIGGLEKFLQSVQLPHTAHIELGKNGGHHKSGDIMFCHVHLTLPGEVLHATADAEDLYAAIDKVHDELERQIIKYKEKAKGL